MVQAKFPQVQVGAYLYDRNYRGDLSDLVELDAEIMQFDTAAGHKTQQEKTTWPLTNREQRSKFMNQLVNGIKPKCPLAIEIVGYVITVARKQVCSFTN